MRFPGAKPGASAPFFVSQLAADYAKASELPVIVKKPMAGC